MNPKIEHLSLTFIALHYLVQESAKHGQQANCLFSYVNFSFNFTVSLIFNIYLLRTFYVPQYSNNRVTLGNKKKASTLIEQIFSFRGQQTKSKKAYTKSISLIGDK